MTEISAMPFTVPFLNNACGAAYSSIPFFSQQEIAEIRYNKLCKLKTA